MQASFTVSKAQDNNQVSQTFFSANQPLDPFNLRNEYSLSNFDQRKRFTMSAVWQPPFSRIGARPLRAVLNGFQFSGILTLTDGRPFTGLHTRIDQLQNHHDARFAEVMQACAEKPCSAADVLPVLFKRQLDLHQTTFAMGEAIAHLHALWFEGKLKRDQDAQGVYRFSPTPAPAAPRP